MYPYIKNEDLNAACAVAAGMLGVSVEEFKHAVFNEKQKEYDRADIISWLNEEGYAYNEDDVQQILETLRSDYNSDMSLWSNIEAAYYNNNMHLPYADDESEEDGNAEPEDSDYDCQESFPQCAKCKHADECEAYQHALKAMDESEQMGIADVFQHDTTGCETFEPAEDECSHCDSHCPCHADCPTANERANKKEANNE